MTLVYVHCGPIENIPHCITDSIDNARNQSPSSSIWLLTDETHGGRIHVSTACGRGKISGCQFAEITGRTERHDEFRRLLSKYTPDTVASFRDGFWLRTLDRFFIIEKFYSLHPDITTLFHIESDVSLFCDLRRLEFNILSKWGNPNKMHYVVDAPGRGIASIVWIPGKEALCEFLDHCVRSVRENKRFMNDMELLGTFGSCATLPGSPEDTRAQDCGVFDGAAIGQYLYGIDSRNLAAGSSSSVGFVNETADLKLPDHDIRRSWDPSRMSFYHTLDGIPVACVHVHTKDIASTLRMGFSDYISGDRIVGECDAVIASHQAVRYHRGLTSFAKVILAYDGGGNNNISCSELASIIQKPSLDTGTLPKVNYTTRNFRLFVYTHEVEHVYLKCLIFLPKDHPIDLVCHNSDESLSSETLQILARDKNIKNIFVQNHKHSNSNVHVLPIGLANSMWLHGNIGTVYKSTHKTEKLSRIYVNINIGTHPVRAELSSVCERHREKQILFSSLNLNFDDYLDQLSNCQFSLCPRGNGIDTHRFWESLYVKTIPIVIGSDFEVQGWHSTIKQRFPGTPILYFEAVCAFDKFLQTATSDNLDSIYKSLSSSIGQVWTPPLDHLLLPPPQQQQQPQPPQPPQQQLVPSRSI